MRRKDREVAFPGEMLQIMEKCDVCYVSFMGEEYPYTVPMNFGMEADGENVKLYFHCAQEGKKLELMRRNPKVSFAMSCGHLFEGSGAGSTMRYASVCGNGRMTAVEADEKLRGLNAILGHYGQRPLEELPQKTLDAVCVLRLEVHELTGKRNAAR
ncbi:MAG: pyridoxamine 5'-phosphate oxidase family protein [Candidatus Faecivicinus sp.]